MEGSRVIRTTSPHNRRYHTHTPTKGARVMNRTMHDPPVEEPKQKPRAVRYETVDGLEAYQWPEFEAFARRLGVDHEAPTTAITIRIACGEAVAIVQEYRGQDLTREKDDGDSNP